MRFISNAFYNDLSITFLVFILPLNNPSYISSQQWYVPGNLWNKSCTHRCEDNSCHKLLGEQLRLWVASLDTCVRQNIQVSIQRPYQKDPLPEFEKQIKMYYSLFYDHSRFSLNLNISAIMKLDHNLERLTLFLSRFCSLDSIRRTGLAPFCLSSSS